MTELVHYARQLHEHYRRRTSQGFAETSIAGVGFFWTAESGMGCPRMYDAGIVILIQGHKVGYVDGDEFRYDPDNYLVVSVPVPFECVISASQDEPMLGLAIDIDIAQLHEIGALAARHQALPPLPDSALRRGVEPVELDDEMRDATARLLKSLCSPLDSEILGPALVKEIIYRAFLGKHGPTLHALTRNDAHYARIARTLARIRQDYANNLTVLELADEAGMSTSAFHRAFKQVTGHSPLQYIKKIRLHRAQRLITVDRTRVSTAAFEVGYESPTQFSREFKRYFKMTPTEARKQGPDWPVFEVDF